MASKHKSFGCYNRNYLLASAIKSGGILCNEQLRKKIIRKFQDIKLICDLYLIKKRNLYKYQELSQKLGTTYDDMAAEFASPEFKFIKLMGSDRRNAGKIVVLIHQMCFNPEAPSGIDRDKFLAITQDEEIYNNLVKFIKDAGAPNLLALKRRRGLFGGILNIFAKLLTYEKVAQFNKKNIENAKKVINYCNFNAVKDVLNLPKIDATINYFESWNNAKVAFPEIVTSEVDPKIVDPAKVDEWEFDVDFAEKIKGLYKDRAEIVDLLNRFLSNYSDYIKLETFYTSYLKFRDMKNYKITDDIEGEMFTYDNQVVDRQFMMNLTNSANLNSPAVKLEYQKVAADKHRAFRIKMFSLMFFRDQPKYAGKDRAEIVKEFEKDPKNWEYKIGSKTNRFPKVEVCLDYTASGWNSVAARMYKYYNPDHQYPDDLYFGDDDVKNEGIEYTKYYSAYYISASMQKQLSGYLCGQLEKGLHKIYSFETDYSYILGDNPDWYKYRLYKPDWNVMGVTTKRWSAGIHTWKPGTDVFRTLEAEKDSVAIYFDISQAEVRSAAFFSGDPTMLEYYEKGIDLYVRMAQIAFPNKTPEQQKGMRSEFKSIVLGLLYGRGMKSIAEQTGLDLKQVAHMVKIFRETFPVLNKFIEAKKQYARDHGGEIETYLGDRLFCEPGRESTCGINYFVQNSASVILGEGFENIYENCYKAGLYIGPKIVVHDSTTVTTHIKNFFEVIKMIDIHFKKYCWDKYGILFKYDLITMLNFRDKIEFNYNSDENKLSLNGYDSAVEDWVALFRKFYTFDMVETKRKPNTESQFHKIINGGELKQYSFYPDNNFIQPGKLAVEITNIKKLS